MNKNVSYKIAQPDESLSDFVEAFWHLEINSVDFPQVIVIPTGSIDILFNTQNNSSSSLQLIGLETKPKIVSLNSLFAVSFKPLAAEYLFEFSVAEILDTNKYLSQDFFNFNEVDVNDFNSFCASISQKLKMLLPKIVDERKSKLFELIFSTNGAMPVKELSQTVYWSTQQINRYFNSQFGLSLKTYCNIIRFHASFKQIREGRLFPEEHFSDQSHFIREVKKLSGVSPKILYKNKNERFIQFSMLDRE